MARRSRAKEMQDSLEYHCSHDGAIILVFNNGDCAIFDNFKDAKAYACTLTGDCTMSPYVINVPDFAMGVVH